MRMKKHVLITGGAGFIGINTADYFLARSYGVTIFDNLSRKGSAENLKWLKKKWGKQFLFVRGDVVTDKKKLALLAEKADAVLHLAAQVAVTTSVENPYDDFHTNAHGTLNVLEAVRQSKRRPLVIYSSTNKVYGTMENAEVTLTDTGYRHTNFPIGVAAHHPVDFHSPYGCSKGAADKYVHDYSRIYGLKTVVFRQSCIYGPHQFGIEDQGWVAWFVISGLLGRPITVYGDGNQVRDLLHVEDLASLYEATVSGIDKVAGRVYNIGGGSTQAFSILSTLRVIERILKCPMPFSFADWRPGDQKVYISDINAISRDLGWEPKISFDKGLVSLVQWAEGEEKLLRKLLA